MNNLDEIKRKIRALKAKTTGAGCTEAEAEAAAELAAKLMAENNLDESLLQIETAQSLNAVWKVTWRQLVLNAVAIATNCAAVTKITRSGTVIEFTGHGAAPEIAVYLYEVAVGAVERARREYQKNPAYSRKRTPKSRKTVLDDFAYGMAQRLGDRIMRLFADQRDRNKALAAQRARDAAHPNAKLSAAYNHRPKNETALVDGLRAGDGVSLNPGVRGGGASPRLIGGAS